MASGRWRIDGEPAPQIPTLTNRKLLGFDPRLKGVSPQLSFKQAGVLESLLRTSSQSLQYVEVMAAALTSMAASAMDGITQLSELTDLDLSQLQQLVQEMSSLLVCADNATRRAQVATLHGLGNITLLKRGPLVEHLAKELSDTSKEDLKTSSLNNVSEGLRYLFPTATVDQVLQDSRHSRDDQTRRLVVRALETGLKGSKAKTSGGAGEWSFPKKKDQGQGQGQQQQGQKGQKRKRKNRNKTQKAHGAQQGK